MVVSYTDPTQLTAPMGQRKETKMKKLINGKVRDTDKMSCIISREGDSNDCYSTYSRIMLDERDNTHYLWSGHFWGGLGPDEITPIDDVPRLVSGVDNDFGIAWDLDENEAEYIEGLLDEQTTQKRIRQVRDALNKCKNPDLIEQVGKLLNV